MSGKALLKRFQRVPKRFVDDYGLCGYCVLPKTGLITVVITSMQYESSLKSETTKFQALHENFCKEKATSLQALKGTPCRIVIVD